MEQRIEAVGIGGPVADLLINVDRLPLRDRGARLLEISYQFGGKVPTAMAALGRLGVRCGMVGAVGGDGAGRACIADFERHNVDTSRMIVDEGRPTRLSVVISDRTGARDILKQETAVRPVRVEELDKAYIVQAGALHLSNAGQAERVAAGWMREAGGVVGFDADGYRREYEDMAEYVDAFITSESYYTDHYPGASLEECCGDIAAKGPGIVVVTLGAKGCACWAGGRLTRLPAFKVDVVDATGAGDTFHGAFLYGMLKKWAPEECARFASAVSAIKCTAIGGRAALPTLEMTEEFMRTGRIDTAEIERRKAFYGKPHGLQP
jgi:sugar/nucleoside kinase (ribokinase family)